MIGRASMIGLGLSTLAASADGVPLSLLHAASIATSSPACR
jgi:hypothetical protein